jgi:hypothetical protein
VATALAQSISTGPLKTAFKKVPALYLGSGLKRDRTYGSKIVSVQGNQRNS